VRAAVEALKAVRAVLAIVLEDVEHTHHLRKDEHLVSLLLELGQQQAYDAY
jgi:hypothetical protein